MIHLPRSSKCWDCRHEPPCPGSIFIFIQFKIVSNSSLHHLFDLGLFRCVLLCFQIFEYFHEIFCYWFLIWFICGQGSYIIWLKSIDLIPLWRFIVWPRIWSVLLSVLEKHSVLEECCHLADFLPPFSIMYWVSNIEISDSTCEFVNFFYQFFCLCFWCCYVTST